MSGDEAAYWDEVQQLSARRKQPHFEHHQDEGDRSRRKKAASNFQLLCVYPEDDLTQSIKPRPILKKAQ